MKKLLVVMAVFGLMSGVAIANDEQPAQTAEKKEATARQIRKAKKAAAENHDHDHAHDHDHDHTAGDKKSH